SRMRGASSRCAAWISAALGTTGVGAAAVMGREYRRLESCQEKNRQERNRQRGAWRRILARTRNQHTAPADHPVPRTLPEPAPTPRSPETESHREKAGIAAPSRKPHHLQDRTIELLGSKENQRHALPLGGKQRSARRRSRPPSSTP